LAGAKFGSEKTMLGKSEKNTLGGNRTWQLAITARALSSVPLI
jgi:hypothetical protein